MNPHEYCITDRPETDNRLRKGLAEFADLQQRTAGIHRSVDDERGAGDNRPQEADREDSRRCWSSEKVQGGLFPFRQCRSDRVHEQSAAEKSLTQICVLCRLQSKDIQKAVVRIGKR